MKKQQFDAHDRMLSAGLDELLNGEKPRDQVEATLARRRRGDLGEGTTEGNLLTLRRALGIGLAAACFIVGIGMMVVARPESGITSRGGTPHAASGGNGAGRHEWGIEHDPEFSAVTAHGRDELLALDPAIEGLIYTGSSDDGSGMEMLGRFHSLRHLKLWGGYRAEPQRAARPGQRYEDGGPHYAITDAGMRVLIGNTSIEKLVIDGCRGVTSEGLQVLGSMSGLRALDLAKYDLTVSVQARRSEDAPARMQAVLAVLPQLKELRVNFMDGTDSTPIPLYQTACDAFVGAFAGSSAWPLRTLHVEQAQAVQDRIVDAVSNCTGIEELSLKMSGISGGYSALSRLPRLRVLDLSSNALTDNDAYDLSTITTLEHLDISGGRNQELTVAGVASLSRLFALRRLNLEGAWAVDASVLASLGQMYELEWLNLRGLPLVGADFGVLARLPKLHTLMLGADRFVRDFERGTRAEKRFGAELAKLAALESLRVVCIAGRDYARFGYDHYFSAAERPEVGELRSATISAEGLEALATCGQLSELDFSDSNDITGPQLAELVRKMPKLERLTLLGCTSVTRADVAHLFGIAHRSGRTLSVITPIPADRSTTPVLVSVDPGMDMDKVLDALFQGAFPPLSFPVSEPLANRMNIERERCRIAFSTDQYYVQIREHQIRENREREEEALQRLQRLEPQQESEAAQPSPPPPDGPLPEHAGIDLSTMTPLGDGLWFLDDGNVANGRAATSGSTIEVRYVGKLADGTIFDQTGSTPVSFKLGQGQLIAGWERGVPGLMVGSKRTLVIPPSLAYGERGAPPKIPPNATLVFEIELVGTDSTLMVSNSVHPATAAVRGAQPSPPQTDGDGMADMPGTRQAQAAQALHKRLAAAGVVKGATFETVTRIMGELGATEVIVDDPSSLYTYYYYMQGQAAEGTNEPRGEWLVTLVFTSQSLPLVLERVELELIPQKGSSVPEQEETQKVAPGTQPSSGLDPYRFRPGSKIDIRIPDYPDDPINQTYVVSSEGTIDLGVIPNYPVAGRTADEICEDLRQKLHMRYMPDSSSGEFLAVTVSIPVPPQDDATMPDEEK